MFPAGEKDGEAVDYGGGRTSTDIVAWAMDQIAENMPAPDVMQVGYLHGMCAVPPVVLFCQLCWWSMHVVLCQIQGFPTIKMFPAGKKTAADVQEYDGGRTSGDIINWAMDKLAENIPAPEIIEVNVGSWVDYRTH